jgi:DNA repair protein RadC
MPAEGMKPGRKLVELGSNECSDAEILAILIGSGGRHFSATDSARELLARYGNLVNLMGLPLDELAQTRGVKARRAIRIAAAFELARRIVQHLEREK